jgi:ligand-binding sensor domain-containing protein
MNTTAARHWLLLCLTCLCLQAAEGSEPRNRPTVLVFSMGEGLPSTTVHDLRPDREGRLWIATVEGPAVYNGRRGSTLALPGASGSKWVRVVRQTSDGSLWFGTDDGGLWRKHGGTWEPFGAQVLGSAYWKSSAPGTRRRSGWGPGAVGWPTSGAAPWRLPA